MVSRADRVVDLESVLASEADFIDDPTDQGWLTATAAGERIYVRMGDFPDEDLPEDVATAYRAQARATALRAQRSGRLRGDDAATILTTLADLPDDVAAAYRAQARATALRAERSGRLRADAAESILTTLDEETR